MIIFIGSAEKGYFAEEIAEKKGKEFAYVKSNSRIELQKTEILEHQGVEYMIFDIQQYLDSAEEIAKQIITIRNCNNATVIIYASGYMLKNKVLVELCKVGIKNFIIGVTLSEIKQQLELALAGYYEANGFEELEIITLQEQEEERRREASYKLIGVAGAMSRIGTTTQALQVVKYLLYKGYKACYIEMNDTGYVENVAAFYDCENVDEDMGEVFFMNVHHFYRQDKISEILKLGYDFYVYDYGVCGSQNFNRTSYLEKDIRLACVGAKVSEVVYTTTLIENEFYTDIYYLFIHVPEADRKGLKESMKDKEERIYFPCYSPEAYEFAIDNLPIYEDIIPLDNKSKDIPQRKSIRDMFKRKKKNGKA